MNKNWFFTAFCGTVLLAGLAAPNGDLQAQGIFGLSEEQEIELGREASAEVEKKEPILEDLQVNGYVEQLGLTLVQRSERPNIDYHFKVIDSDDINAFALPGGWIYVNRGLLEAASNESELAGVLAHEISHVVARHSAEQIKKLQIAGLGVGILGAILGNSKAGQIGGLASQLVATGIFLKYSREAEREADRLGARNLYDAGYDPRGMVTFFDKLAAMRQREPSSVETFFSSHPDPHERSQNISDLIPSFGNLEGLRADSRTFQSMQRRLATLPPPVKRAENADQPGAGQPAPVPGPQPERASYRGQDQDAQIAARFAPVFHVGISARPQLDYPTNFEFDGDWRPDNNAANVASERYRPQAYVYYSLAETETNYFIFYGLFFPSDSRSSFDRWSSGTENKLEVCLVTVEKASSASASAYGEPAQSGRVALVQTLAEGRLQQHLPQFGLLGAFGAVNLQAGRPVLYVDPGDRRISPYWESASSVSGARESVVYRYAGRAEEPGYYNGREVGYDLAPLYPLWSLARQGGSDLFSQSEDLGQVTVATPGYRGRVQNRSIGIGRVGVAFRTSGRGQAARLPWGWNPVDAPGQGSWFLDPAAALGAQLNLGPEFSRVYLHQPYLEIVR